MAHVRVKFPNTHNVFKLADENELDFSRNQPKNIFVHPFMQKLIDKLLQRRPSWEFVSTSFGATEPDGTYTHSRFTVVSQGEELGWIGHERDWRNNGDKYEFACARLMKERQKATTPHTKDLNKAVKTILTHMYGLTTAERMAEVRARTMSHIARERGNSSAILEQHKRALRDAVFDFVEDRWDEFYASPLPQKLLTHRDQLLPAKAHDADVATVYDVHAKGKGVLLFDTGSAYIVSQYASDSTPQIKTLNELDDRLKGSLGILKLLNPKQIAPGIGTRVDDNTYYVVDVDEQQL